MFAEITGFFKEDKGFIRSLLHLSVPIIFQEMLNSSVNMADTVMVGQLGVNEITAVGLANQIFFLFVLIIFGINSGAAIFIGQYWGKRDVKSIHKVMGISFVTGVFVAAVFCFGALFVPESIMGIYSKDSAVIALGADYLKVVGVSYFITAVTVAFNSSLRSTGMTKVPMMTTFCALIVNVVLNYVFIFVLKMGVVGAALATVIARIIELLIIIVLVRALRTPSYSNIRGYFKADAAFIKEFYKLTVPVILNEFIWALGTSIYNVAYKFSGTEAQGAVQISSTVQNLFMVMGMGIGAGCGIIIANCLGAGEIKKAVRYSRKCLVLVVVISVFMGVCLLLSGKYIVSFFDVSETVKGYAFNIIIVISAGMLFKTFNYATIVGILRSGGDTGFCLLIDCIGVWLVGVPCAFIGSYFLKIPIHFTVALVYMEEVFKFVVSLKRVLSNVWAKSVID